MSAEDLVLDDVTARERRWARGRATRRVGVVVSIAVIAATLLALATNSGLDTDGSSFAGPGPTTVPTPGGAPSPGLGDAAPGLPDLGSGAGGADVGFLGGGAFGGIAAPVGAGVPGTAPGGTGGTGGATAAPGGETGPVIVRPVLQFLAFGGQIGMPLLCTIAVSTVGQAAADPGVVAVLSQIQSACVVGANQGADQLRQLDAQLDALAAVNPAVGPVLDELAAALEAASQVDAPFASYLLQVVALIHFLQGQ